MSYFDDASLVMIPSGYKTSKVYSIKPTDASGDLDFVRSNDTATRVGPDGLIEKVRTNVALYSEQFNNANWGPTNATVTANTTTAPDGTTTADSVAFTASSSARLEGLTAGSSPAGEITLSIYAKVASGTGSFRLRGDWSGGNSISTDFAVTTSWQRFTHTFTAASALQIMSLYNNTAGTAQTIIFWGAQAESGVATDYIGPTLGSAVSVGPVANVPRLDYLNSSCPRLLLEPQRTNALTNSENFSSGYFTTDVTVTANTTTSPDGYQSADTITEGTANDQHRVGQIFSAVSGSVYTASIFCKAGNGTRNLAILFGCGFGEKEVVFNVNNGTIVSSSAATGTITNYGNGWYRCTATAVSDITSTPCAQFQLRDGSNQIYTGNGTSSLILWGAQVEVGAYATSYIPTLGAAVTRGQESSSKTSASALIGQTEGTLYSEFVVNGFANFGTALCINDGGTGESIWLTTFTDGTIRAEVYSSAGGGVQATFPKAGNVVGQTYKVAFGYAANNFAFFVNGVQVGSTDTSGSVPVGMNRVDFDYTIPSVFVQSALAIKQAILFPTRLSNADLAALTA